MDEFARLPCCFNRPLSGTSRIACSISTLLLVLDAYLARARYFTLKSRSPRTPPLILRSQSDVGRKRPFAHADLITSKLTQFGVRSALVNEAIMYTVRRVMRTLDGVLGTFGGSSCSAQKSWTVPIARPPNGAARAQEGRARRIVEPARVFGGDAVCAEYECEHETERLSASRRAWARVRSTIWMRL
ncbi:hypothetical protein DFH06DRAFT_1338700 [Mycena polygramma]|nr:hypothetical protein DFH06DRAFT_1338700 [Mycena polygramma]